MIYSNKDTSGTSITLLVQFTLSDKHWFALGVTAIVLGVVILVRTVPVAFSPPAILIGSAFIGFGVYRLRLGYTRLKQLKG